jgi:transposase
MENGYFTKARINTRFCAPKGAVAGRKVFGWLNFFRRLSKDYEKTTASCVAFIQWAFCTVILARIA